MKFCAQVRIASAFTAVCLSCGMQQPEFNQCLATRSLGSQNGYCGFTCETDRLTTWDVIGGSHSTKLQLQTALTMLNQHLGVMMAGVFGMVAIFMLLRMHAAPRPIEDAAVPAPMSAGRMDAWDSVCGWSQRALRLWSVNRQRGACRYLRSARDY